MIECYCNGAISGGLPLPHPRGLSGCKYDQARADYLAARASDSLSYGDILYAQGKGWCPSSPDGMGPHIPDGDTCAECGTTIERTVLA